MKKKKSQKRNIRPPVFSILSSIIVAACVYTAIYEIVRNVRSDIEYGIDNDLFGKMSYIYYAAALGLAALLIIFICVQINNYYSFIKPLKKLSALPEIYTRADSDIRSEIEGIKKGLDESENVVNGIIALSVELSKEYRDVSDNFSQFASSARQLFANSASVDNAVVLVAKGIEARHESARREIYEACALAMRQARAAGAATVKSNPDDYPTLADYSYAAENIAAAGYASARREDVKSALQAFKKYFTKAEEFFDALVQERALITGKFRTFADSIKELTSRANMLSLNAAIESARAGDTGRGFAQIADDIRIHAEDMRGAVLTLHEASEQLEVQAKLIDEVTSLLTSAQYELRAESLLTAVTAEQAGAASGAAGAGAVLSAAAGEYAVMPAAAGVGAVLSAAAAIDDAYYTTYAENTDNVGPPDTAPPFDWENWDKSFTETREELDSIRISIRTVGAALADMSKNADADIKRMERFSELGGDIANYAKSLTALLESIENGIASIGGIKSQPT